MNFGASKFIGLLIILLASTSYAREMTADESALISALKVNSQSLRSARIHYTESCKTIAVPDIIKDRADAVFDVYTETDWLFDHENFQFTNYIREKPFGHKNKGEDRAETLTWNGKRYCTYRSSENGGIIDNQFSSYSINENGILNRTNYWDEIPLYLSLGNLFTNDQPQRKAYHLDSSAVYKGRKVWRLTIGAEGDEEIFIFDPSLGFNVIFRRTFTETLEVQKYKKFEGVWLPVRMTLDVVGAKDGKVVPTAQVIWKIKKVQMINKPVSEAAFDFQYPKGTKVFDAVAGVQVDLGTATK